MYKGERYITIQLKPNKIIVYDLEEERIVFENRSKKNIDNFLLGFLSKKENTILDKTSENPFVLEYLFGKSSIEVRMALSTPKEISEYLLIEDFTKKQIKILGFDENEIE